MPLMYSQLNNEPNRLRGLGCRGREMTPRVIALGYTPSFGLQNPSYFLHLCHLGHCPQRYRWPKNIIFFPYKFCDIKKNTERQSIHGLQQRNRKKEIISQNKIHEFKLEFKFFFCIVETVLTLEEIERKHKKPIILTHVSFLNQGYSDLGHIAHSDRGKKFQRHLYFCPFPIIGSRRARPCQQMIRPQGMRSIETSWLSTPH